MKARFPCSISWTVLGSLICLLSPSGLLFEAHGADCVIPPAGLVSWWPGEGNANDIQSTNNGSLGNGASFGTGRVGQAFSFDGVDDYVQLPPVTQGLSQGTVEFWFNLNTWDWSSVSVGLFLWSGTAYLPGSGSLDLMDFGTYGGGGQLMFGLFPSGWAWANSGVVPQTNTWYHVAGTWGPDGIQIYVNGVLKGSNPYSGAAPGFSYNLIGRSSWPETTVNGLIDEVAIFNRALSSNEIAAIYAAGSAGMCPDTGYIYWSTIAGVTNSVIKRSRLDGTGVEVLPLQPLSGRFGGIAFDVANGHLYSGDSTTLFRANLDGTGRTNLITGVLVYDLELDLVHRRVYWSTGSGQIRRANLDGTANISVIDPTGTSCEGLAVDPVNNRIFYADENGGQLKSADLDGGNINSLATLNSTSGPFDVEFDSSLNRVYWNEYAQGFIPNQKLRWINEDGTGGVQTVLAPPPNGLNNGIHFDGVDQKVYFSSHENPSRIQRCNVDGSGLETVFTETNAPAVNYIEVVHTLVTNEPSPDLAIAQLNAPSNAFPGQPVGLSWVVTNQGNATATGPWTDAISLSSDSIIGGDQFLANSSPFTNALAAGQSITRTQIVILPAGISGQRWFVVTADGGNNIYETNKANNSSIASQPTALLTPDLIVESVTAPPNAQFGQAVPVTWTVRNAGNAPASVTWNDLPALSQFSNSLSGASQLILVPASDIIPLAAGASYTRTQNVVLPLSASSAPGNYYIVISADFNNSVFESDEANNLKASAPMSLTLPSLPDLAVTEVVAPASALAGQPTELAWTVTNQGAISAIGVWSETVSLSNAVSGVQTLEVFTFTNALDSTTFITRTQSVVLPPSGTAGSVWFMVEVDSQHEVFEEDESNNFAMSMDATSVPFQLKLQVSVSETSEASPNPVIHAAITRNGDISQPLAVTLTNGSAAHLSVPTSVIIGAGSPATTFDITVLRDGIVAGTQTVTVTAVADGYQSDTVQITVLDADLPRLTLNIATNSVAEGANVAAIVSRDIVTSNAVIVSLQSSSPSQLSVPTSIVIPGGSNTATFVVLAVDDTLLEPPTSYTLTASASGYQGSTANLTVLDNDVPHVTVSLASHIVSEGAGLQATFATVTRDVVTARAVTLEVVSSDPTVALVPSGVTIPAYQTSASFPVAAVDDLVVDGPRTAAIGAYVLATGSDTRLSQATPDVLTVTDNDGATLLLIVAQKLVKEGLNPATTATVSRNTAPTNDLIISLVSSDLTEATVPPSVTIPIGSSSATFNIASVADGTNDGNQTVTVMASAPGYTSAADTLLVTDTDLPDLVVSNITAPTSTETESFATIAYRVANQGFVTAPSNFLTRVFLSSDPVVGNDAMVGEYRFPGRLPVGEYFDQSLEVQLPQAAGNYWVIVTTDTEQIVPEALEDNNTAISRAPIAVNAGYGAVVSADVHSALAGTPIPLRGRATNSSGAPVASRLVNIHILVRGTERVISAITDDSGDFSVTWQPLASEAGDYQVFATHPGISQAPVQDTFSLLGIKANPATTSLQLVEGSSVVGVLNLENLSDRPLSGLTAQVVSKPGDLSVTLSTATNTLAGLDSTTLGYTFTANTAAASGTVQIRVSSAQGAAVDAYFGVSVEPLRPRLMATPGEMNAGMVRGRQTTVGFDVANVGGISSGPITVSLPEVSWMQLASTNPMPSLAPGETNHVTLLLTPAADLQLGPYPGSLALNAAQTGLSVPFNFRALSEAKGDLLITAVDEYTYYAVGAPRVSGATVALLDPIGHTNIVTGVTDTNGEFLVSQLMEGYYELELTADKHTSYHGNVLISPGQTNELQPFLSRQTVQYIWTVDPVEIEDRYDIKVETVFETFVPVPVVTIEPALVDLATITTEVTQMNFTISNHGLIAANNFTFNFDSHPLWEIKPLITDLGVLPAQGSLTIPVTIRRLQSSPSVGAGERSKMFKAVSKASAGQGPCTFGGNGCWQLLCGQNTNNYCAQVTVMNANPDCQPRPSSGGSGVSGGSRPPPSPPPPPSGTGSGGGSGSGTIFVTGPTVVPPPTCDCFIPFCIGGEVSINIDAVAARLVSAVTRFLPELHLKDTEVKFSVNGQACRCCVNGKSDWETTAGIDEEVKLTFEFGPSFSGDLSFLPAPGWDNISLSAEGLAGAEVVVSGSVHLSREHQCQKEVRFCAGGGVDLQAFAGAKLKAKGSARRIADGNTYSGEIEGQLGLQGDVNASIQGCSDGNLDLTACASLKAVATLSGTLKYTNPVTGQGLSAGIVLGAEKTIAEAGCSTQHASALRRTASSGKIAKLGGDADGAYVEHLNPYEFITPDSEMRRLLGISNAPPAGICARIHMQLDQQAVVSRDAFKAALEILNGTVTPLQNLSVNVVVRNSDGQDVTTLFGIRPPSLINLDAVDGTGTLNGGSTAQASWIIIPTADAAPDAPTQYSVSGTIHYVHDGLDINVPLASVPITVYPTPRLFVKYFHQRDVFADDPFTDALEPSVPFSLAVMIENKGKGEARNFRITSAQPQIVDNQKGLLADFQIIATEVAGRNLTPSLTVDFGNIEPAQIAIGRWLLTSTIQGLFTDYKATFQHVDALGNPKISLIEDLSIHEMTHLVRASGSLEDGKPDFLVNDDGDARALPDTLYMSDGSTNRVQVVEQSTVNSLPTSANPVANLTAPMPAGWSYLLVPEPSDGQLRLMRVQRSDGVEIAFGTNVWTTDRTFIGMGRPPVRENILHLLDYNSSGSYTLYYGAQTPADTNAPTSLVGKLPANSYGQIPLQWAGNDGANGSGIAYFDILVSVNGGQFTPWLQHTTLRGAIYQGVHGNSYAFYSVATDYAGNREPAHAIPDAQTAVNLVNHAPVLASIADQNINEGDTLSVTITATDSDANSLTFSLGPAAPAGVTINPNSGLVTWTTGEAHGPGTNLITVIVRDNGVPSLSDSKTFTVVVNEVNQPPSLAVLSPQTINEGQTLRLPIPASDPDLPPNHLMFALEPGAPAGATIDPATGVLTWPTTEDDGGTTKQFTVRVTDDGSPSMSATQTYTVVVNEVNTPPVIAAIPPKTVDEGTLLGFTAVASDSDRPTNTLAFSLGTGAPTNATINPITGVFTWTPTEEQGPSTNGIKIVVTDNGVPSMSATQTVTVVVNEVNTAPSLVTVSNQVAYVFTRLIVTNRVIDPDIPTNSFTFEMGPGAPAGVEITSDSGVVSWTPSPNQAPSTNVITVIVTDNGVPPLSATNNFTVVVGDYVELSLGSTVLQAGQSGSVPINFMSSAGVTNLSFVLAVPEDRLTNLVLQSLAPQIGASSLQSAGLNRSAVNLGASDGQVLQGTQLLAQLSFLAVSNQTSAFVPLIISDLAAIQGNSLLVPKTLANNGRVVVVGNQSLLEALVSTNGQGTLVLYGIPGTNYILESTDSLDGTPAWQTVWQGTLTNQFQVFQGLDITNEASFYRVRQ